MQRLTAFLIFLCLAIILSFVYFGCDKGEPTKPEPEPQDEFPIKTTGGDPAGFWAADSVDIALVDSSLLDLMELFGVNDFTVDKQLTGYLNIGANNSYDIACTLSVHAVVWLADTTYQEQGGDTLVGTGTLGREIENALIFNFDHTNFRLDTLAYTATADRLLLVSLPSGLSFLGQTIEIYFVLHFVRSGAVFGLCRWPYLIA